MCVWERKKDRDTHTHRDSRLTGSFSKYSQWPGIGLKLGRKSRSPMYMTGNWLLAITATSQGLHWQEAGIRNQNQELSPSTLMWIRDISATRLNTTPPHLISKELSTGILCNNLENSPNQNMTAREIIEFTIEDQALQMILLRMAVG